MVSADKSIIKITFGSILWILVFCQILYTTFVTGQYILFQSNLKLWLDPNYFRHQKVAAILGGDYVLAQRLEKLPMDANYLIASPDCYFFINYYLSPRKMLYYKGVAGEEDFDKISKEWLKENKISYAIFYKFPSFKVVEVGFGKKEGQ